MKRANSIAAALLTLCVMMCAAGPIIHGSNQSLQGMYNAPFQWISQDHPSLTTYAQFVKQFGTIETMLVSWPGCTVDDPRLPAAAEYLAAIRERRAAAGEPPLFNQVHTGYGALRMLMGGQAGLSREIALRRLKGVFVGPDGETTCAIVVLTAEGSSQRRRSFDLIVESLEQLGHRPEDLRLAGTLVDGLATDEESTRSLQYYSLPSIVVSFILCCLCLRSIWLSLPILIVGALGQGVMLASVYYLDMTMNAVLIVLPALVFVLTVSAGVHIVNYFYQELRIEPVEQATERALRKAWGPCALAAVTTAIGLASLIVSEIEPVRQFGALAAIGVLLTVALLFLVLPGAMECRLILTEGSSQLAGPVGSRQRAGKADIWNVATDIIMRFHRWIGLGCLAAILFCGSALFWLSSSVNVVSLLAPETRAVQDFHWFEDHLGPLVPVEVTIHFADDCTLDSLQRMEIVRSAQMEVGKLDALDGAMSAASFFPPIPPPGGIRNTARRRVMRKLLEERQTELVEAQYLHIAKTHESWRISARIFGRDDFDYHGFLDRLRDKVAPVISLYEELGYDGVTASYTGVTAVTYEVEEALLADLFDSFLVALVLISIIMMIALRSITAGIFAMVPNVFPTVILFGSMGWLGRPVDIGTVMTASVALGIAVDGTFHFLKWFRHELAEGRSRRHAVAYAYRHCGRALTQTTVICALGLLVFALSSFLPARHFSVVLLLLLVAALVGDLVVLPTLLVGRVGRLFSRTPSQCE